MPEFFEDGVPRYGVTRLLDVEEDANYEAVEAKLFFSQLLGELEECLLWSENCGNQIVMERYGCLTPECAIVCW